MPAIEDRLSELGLRLPALVQAPPGVTFTFELVRVAGDVAYVAGHGPINGFSDLIVELWGDAGRHARSAIGVAELPLDMPVEIEAIVQL